MRKNKPLDESRKTGQTSGFRDENDILLYFLWGIKVVTNIQSIVPSASQILP
ncbi:hypothetical protein Hanom_Chr07g00674921 [Helianthus anomalus]